MNAALLEAPEEKSVQEKAHVNAKARLDILSNKERNQLVTSPKKEVIARLREILENSKEEPYKMYSTQAEKKAFGEALLSIINEKRIEKREQQRTQREKATRAKIRGVLDKVLDEDIIDPRKYEERKGFAAELDFATSILSEKNKKNILKRGNNTSLKNKEKVQEFLRKRGLAFATTEEFISFYTGLINRLETDAMVEEAKNLSDEELDAADKEITLDERKAKANAKLILHQLNTGSNFSPNERADIKYVLKMMLSRYFEGPQNIKTPVIVKTSKRAKSATKQIFDRLQKKKNLARAVYEALNKEEKPAQSIRDLQYKIPEEEKSFMDEENTRESFMDTQPSIPVKKEQVSINQSMEGVDQGVDQAKADLENDKKQKKEEDKVGQEKKKTIQATIEYPKYKNTSQEQTERIQELGLSELFSHAKKVLSDTAHYKGNFMNRSNAAYETLDKHEKTEALSEEEKKHVQQEIEAAEAELFGLYTLLPTAKKAVKELEIAISKKSIEGADVFLKEAIQGMQSFVKVLQQINYANPQTLENRLQRLKEEFEERKEKRSGSRSIARIESQTKKVKNKAA